MADAQRRLAAALADRYPPNEAGNMADWVMEAITEWKKLDRLVHAEVPLTDAQIEQLDFYSEQLLSGRPIQYVLGEAWFYGYSFQVNEHVLIPRPETEELVEWIYSDLEAEKRIGFNGSLLDVGTGSGCIPITLKKILPTWSIHTVDVSKEALQLAQKNAAFLQAEVEFHHQDFLDASLWMNLPQVDVLVSNPPYIPMQEKEKLAPHVVEFEPALALFVPDDDALVFYRALAQFAGTQLKEGGAVYVEMHEDLSAQTLDCFTQAGFSRCELKKDLQGKTRMLRARR